MGEPDGRPTHAVVRHEREVNTYAHLWAAAQSVLEKAQAAQEGAAWLRLSSIMLTAFTFEAYMNHVGDSQIANWDDLEYLAPLKKLRHLTLALNVDVGGAGARPIQTLVRLFKVRNKLAHGRTEHLRPKDEIVPIDHDIDAMLANRPQVEWEECVRSNDFPVRAQEDVEAVLSIIHAALPEPKEPLFHFGLHFSGGSAHATVS